MDIFPIYRFGSLVLIELDIDYSSNKVKDGLVIELNLKDKTLVSPPWSGQKKLKFGFYDAVKESERSELIKEIHSVFGEEKISAFIEMLLHPSDESIKSLIWIPDRLKK
jgi:hypothetical protein